MRAPDRFFIDSLKKEMVENPTLLVSPIVGLACLDAGEEFDSCHPQSYIYETIGGNNSRLALQELAKARPECNQFKTCTVAVYVSLPDKLILRLASKHNQASGFTHAMTIQDKVRVHALYYN